MFENVVFCFFEQIVTKPCDLQNNSLKEHFFFFLKQCEKVKAKVSQSCPTLCDPINCTVHGLLQARIREWVAFPLSRGSSQAMDRTQVFHIAGGFFTS